MAFAPSSAEAWQLPSHGGIVEYDSGAARSRRILATFSASRDRLTESGKLRRRIESQASANLAGLAPLTPEQRSQPFRRSRRIPDGRGAIEARKSAHWMLYL